MNEFTVTSEIKELDEFDKELVIKNIQKVFIKIANEKRGEKNDRSYNNVDNVYN